MKPGDEVKVIAFGGEELKRIVVQIFENTIVICKREEWIAARLENRQPNGVGFPASSVNRII